MTAVKEINILFLGGAKRVSLARKLIAAGEKKQLRINIFSYELSHEVPIAAVGRVIVGRRWSDDDLMGHLHEAVIHYGIHIMLPFVDPAVEVAGRYMALYHDVWAPVVEPELAARLFDKWESARLFADNGLPIPRTYTGGRPRFPLIAKPRKGSASKGLVVVEDVPEFRRFIRRNDYMMEAYIADRTEYTVDAYVDNGGNILCLSPRLRIEVLGGEVVRSMTVDEPRIADLATMAIDRLELRGPVTLQFIRDNTDDSLMLMEINPRLGGGVVCSIHAGADIPRLLLEEYLGENPERIPDVQSGVLICRYFDETVFNYNA